MRSISLFRACSSPGQIPKTLRFSMYPYNYVRGYFFEQCSECFSLVYNQIISLCSPLPNLMMSPSESRSSVIGCKTELYRNGKVSADKQIGRGSPPCNEHPWKPHFIKKKWGLQLYNFFFLFWPPKIDCGYLLETPHRGGSNEHQLPILRAKKKKILDCQLKNNDILSHRS